MPAQNPAPAQDLAPAPHSVSSHNSTPGHIAFVQPVAPQTASPKVVIDAQAMARTITRISHQILEHTTGGRSPVLLGIPTRGEQLASRLAKRMAALSGGSVAHGAIDVTAYRDDTALRGARTPARTVIPGGGVDEKHVILVDDVLYSGRTVRAALDAIRELGRPAVVQLAVLIDRGHRELPIRADYVGKNLPTSREENVKVRLTETDGEDAVVITRRDPAARSTVDGAR